MWRRLESVEGAELAGGLGEEGDEGPVNDPVAT